MALSSVRRVVLTGGPGGGKTTAADLLRREIGARVVVVPEAATMLFSGGFPRLVDDGGRAATQTAIFHVQRAAEAVFAAAYPDRVLLCDRGTIDGAAYWPGPSEAFFASAGTTLHDELRRYDEVIFFETAAVGGLSIEGGNPVRIEDEAAAIELDRRLQALWSSHPRLKLIRHERSFLHKMTAALVALQAVID